MKGIVEIIGDVVKEMSGNLTIIMPADIENDRFEEVKNPELNYIFGSAQYVKDKLDEYSKVPSTSERKFPLVVLFCPVTEKRDSLDYYSKVSLKRVHQRRAGAMNGVCMLHSSTFFDQFMKG